MEDTAEPSQLERARKEIDLAQLGIGSVRIREAATGAMVPGAEGFAKADALSDSLRRCFAELDGVKIIRPVRKAEIKLHGLDQSIRPGELAAALATGGGCKPKEMRVGDIKSPTRDMGTVWTQCPIAAALFAAAARTIQVGWSRVVVELLNRRPLQCFRLKRGHVQQHCSSPVDRRLGMTRTRRSTR